MAQGNNVEQQFANLLSLIERKRSEASRAVNEKQLTTAWVIGGYVSSKLKTEEWGSKVVTQFAEYIKVNAPHLKGFSRANIYNMVMFYDEYSALQFTETALKYLPSEFVQTASAQIQEAEIVQTPSGQLHNYAIMQTASAQLSDEKIVSTTSRQIVKPVAAKFKKDDLVDGNGIEIVQMPSGLLWKLLNLTPYSNHMAILSRCRFYEQRLFYILYSHKERLSHKELQRCIATDTFSRLLGKKNNMSKALLDNYPQSPVLFKDTLFVDFLGLPQKHTESKLRKGIVEHMKQFVLELGKDFLFVDQEYYLEVGASRYKSDLLFYHRGLQCLVAVELKKTKFHPRDLGQLEFYLEALDRDVKRSNENPSIGIILCPEADNIVVEYAMSRSLSPTMVAEYKRLLIPQEKMQLLLREYCANIAEKN